MSQYSDEDLYIKYVSAANSSSRGMMEPDAVQFAHEEAVLLLARHREMFGEYEQPTPGYAKTPVLPQPRPISGTDDCPRPPDPAVHRYGR